MYPENNTFVISCWEVQISKEIKSRRLVVILYLSTAWSNRKQYQDTCCTVSLRPHCCIMNELLYVNKLANVYLLFENSRIRDVYHSDLYEIEIFSVIGSNRYDHFYFSPGIFLTTIEMAIRLWESIFSD